MSNKNQIETVKRNLNKRISIANDENATNTIAVQKLQKQVFQLYGMIAVLGICIGLLTWLG